MIFVVPAIVCCVQESAHPHGSVHTQIGIVTDAIASSPADAALRLQRAQLHALDENWAAAEADFADAERLDPSLIAVDFARGEMLRAAGRSLEAVAVLDRFVGREPRNSSGLAARGRALMAAGLFQRAADDFAAARELREGGDAELCHEQARALVAGGRPAAALAALDSGIAQCGPLVTLIVQAVDIETSLRRHEAALVRLDAFMACQPRKERWLARRGEILEMAGRQAEAATAFREAVDAIARLPEERRSVAMIAALQRDLHANLARLEAMLSGGCAK